MDPLPSHPKSHYGCFKWIGMVEKQWFWCHAGKGHHNGCQFWALKHVMFVLFIYYAP
jgi:hypothetical protein